ncbi:MAG: class I SAM-dependent methyltransferase [Lysobacteraceae bacterium]|nr:MAG: class I SAM-dependent methyltransferase [Xanthomonadaceae bacterium]
MSPLADRLIQWLRPFARQLPERVKRRLRHHLRRRFIDGASAGPVRAHEVSVARDDAYEARVAEETRIFAGQAEVHDLPPIFHYWSNAWLRPQLESFGFSNPDQFFARYLADAHEDALAAGHPARFASLGCGNCDTEVRVARLLLDRGITRFTIDCVDINDAMLERGRRMAEEHGVGAHIVPARGDFNDWRPSGQYDAVLANQSLHHVVNLEGLFAAVDAALMPAGRFVTSDMIGRNGHMRWPEAVAIVQEFWQELPASYRRNVQLHRNEPRFLDWDCSIAGFEGVRAQDILPLLLARFDFEFFFAYGNVIDPFIDRGFGPNFDAEAAWDRSFIDRVHARDETALSAGEVTPTHMLAVLRRRPWSGTCAHRPGLAPERCVRRPA